MSVIDTVKRKVGLEEQKAQYECQECGERFRSGTEEGSFWFECPDCRSDDVTEVEST